MITAIAALLAATVVTVPGTTPIFCKTDENQIMPMEDVTFADLKKSFEQNLSMSPTLVMTGAASGILRFQDAEDTVTYDVMPYKGGLVLSAMRVRMTGGGEDMSGDKLCMFVMNSIELKP